MIGVMTGSIIYEESLLPKSGTSVYITPISPRISDIPFEVKSDADGMFVLEIPSGLYEISTDTCADSYLEREVFDGTTTFVQLEVPKLQPTTMDLATLNIEVLNELTDLPIPDLAVLILKANGPFPDILPITNSEGKVTLDDLPSGPLTIKVSNNTFQIKLQPGKLESITLHIEA